MSIINQCSSGNFKQIQALFTQRKIRVMRLTIEYSFFVEKNGKNPDIDFCESRFNEFIGKLNELYREKGDYLLLLAYDTHITKSSGKVFHQMIMTYPMDCITPKEWSDLWKWGHVKYNVISYERPCLKLERLRFKKEETKPSR